MSRKKKRGQENPENLAPQRQGAAPYGLLEGNDPTSFERLTLLGLLGELQSEQRCNADADRWAGALDNASASMPPVIG